VNRDSERLESCCRSGHRPGDREDDEKRRPLGEDHVLQQVRGQEVVQPEVMERCPERDRKQDHRSREAGDTPPRRAEPADQEQIEQ